MIDLALKVCDLRFQDTKWFKFWVIDHWGAEVCANIEEIVLNADQELDDRLIADLT